MNLSDDLIDSHLKRLKITTRKDSKNPSKWMYKGISYTTEDYVKEIARQLNYDFAPVYKDIDKIELETRLCKFLQDKYTKGIKTATKNQLAKTNDISLRNSITTIQGIEPTNVFNDEDRRLWNKFYYCEEDGCYYIFDGIRFKYVAPCVPVKPDEIRHFIREYARVFNRDFSTNFAAAVVDASKLSIALHNSIKAADGDATNILTASAFKDIVNLIDDEHKENSQLISEDYLMGLIVKDLFDNKTPSTIWRGFAQLQRRNIESNDPETDRKFLSWNGFYARTPANVAVTISKYIENVLVNYGEELRDNLTTLKLKPKFIAKNEGENAMNVLNRDALRELTNIPKSDIEKTTLWNYLATLSPEQRRYVAAWCYNTVFHIKDEPIHLVLWDLGGTGKTSLLAQTIRTFCKKLYNNEYYYIKGSEFENTTARYDPLSNTDIADAIFCLIDDITSANLETFADTTGSKNNTITVKKLYTNEYAKPNNTKFILATNYPLSIKRKDAFRRRTAIIHTKVSNTWKTSQTADEFMKCFMTDASTILLYWKKCYDSIIDEFGSLVNAASEIKEIAVELENATEVDENLDEVIDEVLRIIKENNKGQSVVKVPNSDWKEKVSMLTGKDGKSYLRSITTAQVRARFKQMPNIKVNQQWTKDGQHCKGIIIKFDDVISLDTLGNNDPDDPETSNSEDLGWADTEN